MKTVLVLLLNEIPSEIQSHAQRNPDGAGGGGYLPPKWIQVCPHGVTKAMGADEKTKKKRK